MIAPPYARVARVYDILYDELFDAHAESEGLQRMIRERLPDAHDLLDVACGR